jgi:peptide/nickel transport system permease protein
MTVLPLDAADEVATEPVPPARRRALPGFLRRPGGILSVVWLVLITVGSLTAPLWVPYEVAEQDTANRLALPSADHWLGTDPLGRDLLSRIFTGGTQPLACAALMLLVAFGIGVPLALIAAERGAGWSGSSAGSPRSSWRCRC